jgi:hypothetical protein
MYALHLIVDFLRLIRAPGTSWLLFCAAIESERFVRARAWEGVIGSTGKAGNGKNEW